MIANLEIINAINELIGNEFGAMLQYYVVAAHFDGEGPPGLSARFYERAEEEKKHALRMIQFVIDTGARVNVPAVAAPKGNFKSAEDAIKFSLEQEERITTQVNAVDSMARAAHFMDEYKTTPESDRTAANFLGWLVKEQAAEIALMEQLLRAVRSGGEGRALQVEDPVVSEQGHGTASIELGQAVVSKISALSAIVLLCAAKSKRQDVISEQELNEIVSKTEASAEVGKVIASVVPDETLRDIVKHLEEETAKIRESLADPSGSNSRRQRELKRAEAEICVDLKTIQSHNSGVMPDVPALAKAWEEHRAHAFLTTTHA
jgi:bacterioferritin B